MIANDVGLDAFLASSVPSAWADYSEPLLGALGHFLDALSPARAGAITAGLAALGPDASPADRLVALAARSPTLHKLGQVLARDRRVDPDLREALRRLDAGPLEPASSPPIRPLIEREIGDLEQLGVALEPAPLAETSVAWVVGFTWHGRRGVFKVIRPGVEEALEEELAVLGELSDDLDERCAAHHLPPLDSRALFDGVARRLAFAVRIEAERRHLEEAGRALGRVRGVRAPELLPFESPRLLAVERIEGRGLLEARGLSALERRRLAGVVVEALVAAPAWSSDPSALFHADPHAGNLAIEGDGQLVALDWNLASHLNLPCRAAMTRMLVGAVTRDVHSILAAIDALALRPVDPRRVRGIVERRVHALNPLAPAGLSWLMDMLDEAGARAELRLPASLLAFRETLRSVDGVVSDLSPGFSTDHALVASFLSRLAAESLWRPFLPPESRDLPTRLSNVDLARVAVATPWIATLAALQPSAWPIRLLRTCHSVN